MNRIHISRLAAGLTIVLILGSIAGCTPTAEPDATTSSTPTPSETVVEPTAEPTPEPTVEPAAATCENLVDSGSFAGVENAAFVLKIRGEGAPIALFDEYGGIMCIMGGALEVDEIYGYSPINTAQQAAQEARLVGEGYVMASVDGGTLYVDSTEAQDVTHAFYFRNGFWWCGYDAARITEIVANSPAS